MKKEDYEDTESSYDMDMLENNGYSDEMERLLDLHVLIVPKELWLNENRTANNTAVHESKSAGFIRTHPFTSLFEMRNVIASQLGDNTVPDYYIFLRSVGRCLVAVHRNQETELTAADFVRYPAFEILLLPCGADQNAMTESDKMAASKRTEVDILRNQLDTLRMEGETLKKSDDILKERRKQLLSQVRMKREADRDAWKQKYLLEKSKTEHLEEELSSVSKSVESLTKTIAKREKEEKAWEIPSQKNNLRNTVTRLEKEVAEVKTRYKNILRKVEKETSEKKMLELELKDMMRVKTQRAIKSI